MTPFFVNLFSFLGSWPMVRAPSSRCEIVPLLLPFAPLCATLRHSDTLVRSPLESGLICQSGPESPKKGAEKKSDRKVLKCATSGPTPKYPKSSENCGLTGPQSTQKFRKLRTFMARSGSREGLRWQKRGCSGPFSACQEDSVGSQGWPYAPSMVSPPLYAPWVHRALLGRHAGTTLPTAEISAHRAKRTLHRTDIPGFRLTVATFFRILIIPADMHA